jgi:hypothetical protein
MITATTTAYIDKRWGTCHGNTHLFVWSDNQTGRGGPWPGMRCECGMVEYVQDIVVPSVEGPNEARWRRWRDSFSI